MRIDCLERAAIRLIKKEMSRMPAEHHSFDFIIDQLQGTTTTDRDWASMGASMAIPLSGEACSAQWRKKDPRAETVQTGIVGSAGTTQGAMHVKQGNGERSREKMMAILLQKDPTPKTRPIPENQLMKRKRRTGSPSPQRPATKKRS
ncbi:hypothetical protein B0A48_01818 [Cryoendolithus antarcticus]|uniref:Uncharacterized protein n=1 Tax=Cryoendolithus antarcticus TaxID=1507870 RepID=A0A1V8TQD2_9PEZI|nr:hypothetical protein B0A48_01818 [Cryoendolithus antarcticus]